MTDFHRTFVNDRSFIRGAARLLVAPSSQARPTKIADVINLTSPGTNEVQSLAVTGTPTGGSFTVTYLGTPVTVAYNSSAAALQTSLEGVFGAGNVTAIGGPLPGDAITITFTGSYGAQNVALPTVSSSGLTGGTDPAAAVTTTTAGEALYDAKSGWTDLGATKTGIQITINNAEESFDVDQILGDIYSAPTNWECSVGTQLAEMTPERMQVAWEGSAISVDTVPAVPEQEIGFGNPLSYTERRLAVLFQRPNGKIRAYLFHRAQRMPQESSITHSKTGEQISIPVRLKVLADSTVSDPLKRFFIIRDQYVS